MPFVAIIYLKVVISSKMRRKEAEGEAGKASHLEDWKQRKKGSLKLKSNTHETRLAIVASVILDKVSSKTIKEGVTGGVPAANGSHSEREFAGLIVKRSSTLWSSPPCPQPAFCLWKNFSPRISLIREMRKYRNKGRQSNKTE